MDEGFDICLCYNQPVPSQRLTPNRMGKHHNVEFFLIFLHMQTISSVFYIIPTIQIYAMATDSSISDTEIKYSIMISHLGQ